MLRDYPQAMSQANVDSFLKCAEAFNRFAEAPEKAADPEDVNTWLAFYDPDVRFEPQQAALQGTYVGREGVGQWLADLAEHYSGGSLHFADVRDLGDSVLALGTLRVKGRGSGIETEVPVAITATFRDGLVAHFKDYGDARQALEAVGEPE